MRLSSGLSGTDAFLQFVCSVVAISALSAFAWRSVLAHPPKYRRGRVPSHQKAWLAVLVFTGLSGCGGGGGGSSNVAPSASPPADAPPTASNASVTANYGAALSGTLNAHDPDNDHLTYEIVDKPTLGSLDLDSATGDYTYTPPALRVGTDTFTYRASDGKKTSNEGVVTIAIEPAYESCEQCIPDFQEAGVMERGAAVVDLNGDGLKDFFYSGPAYLYDPDTGTFITNTKTPLRILMNDGTGNFVDGTGQVISGPVPAFVQQIASVVADFNGDGLPDLFLADQGRDDEQNEGQPNVLMLSDSSGHLVDASKDITGKSCDSPTPLTVGAPVCATVDYQSVYEGATVSSPPVSSVHSVAAADIDGDGDIDIFVGTISWPRIQTNQYFLMNDGRGHFTVDWSFVPIEMRMFGGGPQWISARLVDLDGDSLPDLVVGGMGPSYVPGRYAYTMIFWNGGNGDFSRGSVCETAGDGGCELALSKAEVTVLPTVEHRTYPTETVNDSVEQFHLAAALATADIDGDGDLDLIVANVGDPAGVGWEGRYVQVFINHGDRGFTDETATRFPTQTGKGRWIAALKVIDFNGDGNPDLLAQHDNLSGIGYSDLIWINDGKGRFAALDNNVLGKTGWLHPIDVDGDGDLDFLDYNDIGATSPTHVQDFTVLRRRH